MKKRTKIIISESVLGIMSCLGLMTVGVYSHNPAQFHRIHSTYTLAKASYANEDIYNSLAQNRSKLSTTYGYNYKSNKKSTTNRNIRHEYSFKKNPNDKKAVDNIITDVKKYCQRKGHKYSQYAVLGSQPSGQYQSYDYWKAEMAFKNAGNIMTDIQNKRHKRQKINRKKHREANKENSNNKANNHEKRASHRSNHSNNSSPQHIQNNSTGCEQYNGNTTVSGMNPIVRNHLYHLPKFNKPVKSLTLSSTENASILIDNKAKHLGVRINGDGTDSATVKKFTRIHLPDGTKVPHLYGHIYVLYPNAITYTSPTNGSKKTLSVLMDLDLHHSIVSPYNADSSYPDEHSIQIAKAINNGVYYRGVERLEADFTAYDSSKLPGGLTQKLVDKIEGNKKPDNPSGTSYGQAIPGDWISIDSLNGVKEGNSVPSRKINSQDVPLPPKSEPASPNSQSTTSPRQEILHKENTFIDGNSMVHTDSRNFGSYGEWVNYNSYETNKGRQAPKAYTLNNTNIGNFRKNMEPGLLQNTGDAGVNGGMPNKQFDDGWLPQYAEEYAYSHSSYSNNWAKAIVRDFDKNSIFFQLGGDTSNIFDFGSGRSTYSEGHGKYCETRPNHGAWFKISEYHQPPLSDKIRCAMNNVNGKPTPQITNHGKVLSQSQVLGLQGLDAQAIGVSKHDESKNHYLNSNGAFNGQNGLKAWENDSNVGCYIPKIPQNPNKTISGLHQIKSNNSYNGKYALNSNYEKFAYNLSGQIPDVDAQGLEDHESIYSEGDNQTQGHEEKDKYGITTCEPGQANNRDSCTIDHYYRNYDGEGNYHVDSHDNYVITDKLPKEIRPQHTGQDVAQIGNYVSNGDDFNGNQGDGQNINCQYDKATNTVTVTLNAKAMSDMSNKKYTLQIPVVASKMPSAKRLAHYNDNQGLMYEMDNGDKGTSSNNHRDGSTYAYSKSTIYDGHVSDDSSQGDYDSKYSKTTYTNMANVVIPIIKTYIYKYNWNNSSNYYHRIFPDSQQVFGNCGSQDYTNPNYKQYVFNKYYNDSYQIAHRQAIYSYANHVFSEPDTVTDPSNPKIKYHTVYPMNPNQAWRNLHYNLYSGDNQQQNQEQETFSSEESTLQSSKSNPNFTGTRVDDGITHYVPIKVTPDHSTRSDSCSTNQPGWGPNNYNPTFTQSVFIPYIIPTIDLDCTPGTKNCPVPPAITTNKRVPRIVNKEKFHHDESARFVIDTDKSQHGLPFHLITSAYNTMYNYQMFKNNFDGTDITLNITDPQNGVTLYTQSRPLIDMVKDTGDNTGATKADNESRWSHPEYPEGYSNWKGFIDKDALQKAHIDESYGLDTVGEPNSSRNGFPVRASFSITKNPQKVSIPSTPINTHAYIASRPQVQRSSLGKKYITKFGSGTTISSSNNSNLAQFIMPERTVAYGTDSYDETDTGNNKTSNIGSTYVRDLDEELDMKQPHNQSAKAGYGIRANDIKLTYYGHINPLQYAQQGTGLMTSYPKDFNYKDSNIHDTEDHFDPSTHKMDYDKEPYKTYAKQNFLSSGLGNSNIPYSDNLLLTTPMIHVKSKSSLLDNTDGDNQDTSTNNIQNNSDNSTMPSDLDSASNDSSIEDMDFLDNIYDNTNSDKDSKLTTGTVKTSYGYLPKQISTQASGKSGIVSLRNKQFEDSHENNRKQFTHAKDMANLNDSTYSQYSTPQRWGHHNDEFHLNDGATTWNNNQPSHNMHMNSLQDNRLFLQQFLHTGEYPMYFESNFYNGPSLTTHSYNTRLGGNFFRINDKNPLHVYAHMFITRNDSTEGQAFDEFSPQPVLTDIAKRKYVHIHKGIHHPEQFSFYQIPKESPKIPKIKKSHNQYYPMSDLWKFSFNPNHNSWDWLLA